MLVAFADENTKLLLTQCKAGGQEFQLAMSLINMILVSTPLLGATQNTSQTNLLFLSLQECSGVKGHFPVDEHSSDMPFGFWYNLEVRKSLNSSYCAHEVKIICLMIAMISFQDEILASEVESFMLLQPIFIPVFMSLVERMLKKSEYPSDTEFKSWNDGWL